MFFDNDILGYIGLISVFTIPVLFYSIYLQKVVLKKWCLLCLGISVILILYCILFILNYDTFSFEIKGVVRITLLLLIITIGRYFAKRELVFPIKNNNELKSLIRFKRKEEVFYKIAQSIDNNKEIGALELIQIGDKNKKNNLFLFISPSCSRCHTAFKEALELLEKNNDALGLQIGYNLNSNNLDNPYIEIASIIIALHNNNKDYLQALKDWHIEKMDKAKWIKKWKFSFNELQINEVLSKQFNWCIGNDFNYAPIKILNEVLVSSEYEINELFYFFKE